MAWAFPHASRKMRSLRGLVASLFFSAVLFCALLLLATVASAAAPPQAPQLPQAPEIPGCGCGCMTPGVPCTCKNCCERTGDPTWTPAQSAKGVQQYKLMASPVATVASAAPAIEYEYRQVCTPNGCRMVKVAKTPSSFATTGPARVYGDFIYDPADQPGQQPADPGPGQGGSCQSGSSGTGFQRQPFRPIRNLIGRIQQRRGGGCSSCGN